MLIKFFIYFVKLCFARAAEDVSELVADDLLDIRTGGLQILARIELVGMLVEELADRAGHSETEIGVDIDLANGKLRRVTELLLRHADGVGHLAAVRVDHLNVLLRYGAGTVQNDREAGKPLGNFLKNVKTERRRDQNALLVHRALLGLELVSAVRSTDGDGKAVHARLGTSTQVKVVTWRFSMA